MTDLTVRPAAAIRGEVAALQLLAGLIFALRKFLRVGADIFGDGFRS